jgi:hypothetical protein
MDASIAALLGRTDPPDLFSMRVSGEITPTFADGSPVTSWTELATGTVITCFGSGRAPFALKGVAVWFGALALAGDRVRERQEALDFLHAHLADSPGPAWRAGSAAVPAA